LGKLPTFELSKKKNKAMRTLSTIRKMGQLVYGLLIAEGIVLVCALVSYIY